MEGFSHLKGEGTPISPKLLRTGTLNTEIYYLTSILQSIPQTGRIVSYILKTSPVSLCQMQQGAYEVGLGSGSVCATGCAQCGCAPGFSLPDSALSEFCALCAARTTCCRAACPYSPRFLVNGMVNECLLLRRKHQLPFKRKLVFLHIKLIVLHCTGVGGLGGTAMNTPPKLSDSVISARCKGVSRTKGEKRKELLHLGGAQPCNDHRTGSQCLSWNHQLLFSFVLTGAICTNMMLFVSLQHSPSFIIIYKGIIKTYTLLRKVNHLARGLKP